MNLLQFCNQVGGDLRIEWDRIVQSWRVRIEGASYKLSPGGTSYGAYSTVHHVANKALEEFTIKIRGAKMRLHGGKAFNVPVILSTPFLTSPMEDLDPMTGPCEVGEAMVTFDYPDSVPQSVPFPFKKMMAAKKLEASAVPAAEVKPKPVPKPEKTKPFF